MIELPNPFADEGGVIRLLEADDCNRESIIAQVLADTYNKPFVIEEGDSRSLYFSRDFTQSGMRLSDTTALEFAYTRKMMSFLLFVHEPRHILMLGLGGGSLAKFCYRHLPGARITAVEIDANVLAFRDQFLLPPNDVRLNILQGDAANYLRDCTDAHDVVMIDAFDRDGFAAAVSSRGFYLDVRAALSANGAMVANMVGPKAERATHLDMIADVFNGNIVVLPIKSDGNYLVFAFRDSAFEPRWRWIESQASAMQKRFGLDFPKFAATLKRSRKDGYLQTTLLQNEEL
jgi:spermidine synthase